MPDRGLRIPYRSALLTVLLTAVLLLMADRPGYAQGESSATPPPTNTLRPTHTPPATRTVSPTRTPTVTATLVPTMVIMGTYQTPVASPMTPIPPPAPVPAASADDIVTIMLLGSDNLTPGVVSNTDSLILVAVDRTASTVSMMHLARDTFVYAPGHTMMKLNQVMITGDKDGPGEGGKLMKATILYNFGVKVDFYAHLNFYGFQQVIFQLGGLDVSVNCAIQGHRLKSPKMDAFKADSYELFTMPIGYQKLDPYMALWYVRSRGSSSDIDRGRRQMDVLRAIWHQAKGAGLLTQITQLWPEAQKLVETDMTLQDVLGLAPTALTLDPDKIQHLNVDLTKGYKIWYTPDKGEYALLMNRDVWQKAMQDFLTPPTANRLGGENPVVAIGAALPLKGFDQVAADELAWDGFSTQLLGAETISNRDQTIVYDYTGNAKPSSREALRQALRIDKSAIVDKPDPNRTVDFRVEMGRDYGRSCLYKLPPEYQDGGTATPHP